MISVIEKSFPRIGLFCASLYAALCLGLSLVLGGAIQSEAIAKSGTVSLGISGMELLLPLIITVSLLVM
jgi:hypothetical protein